MQGLQLKKNEFDARHTEIVAISVDPVTTNAELAGDLGLEYRVLSDAHVKAIDDYDVRHPGGHDGSDIARPATFLIDAQGVVRWRNLAENIRNRPHPEDILAQIDQLGG